MAGEAQADEPLAVEFLGHLFQNGNTAVVVFNEVVVGGKDRCDLVLNRLDRKLGLKLMQMIPV